MLFNAGSPYCYTLTIYNILTHCDRCVHVLHFLIPSLCSQCTALSVFKLVHCIVCILYGEWWMEMFLNLFIASMIGRQRNHMFAHMFRRNEGHFQLKGFIRPEKGQINIPSCKCNDIGNWKMFDVSHFFGNICMCSILHTEMEFCVWPKSIIALHNHI